MTVPTVTTLSAMPATGESKKSRKAGMAATMMAKKLIMPKPKLAVNCSPQVRLKRLPERLMASIGPTLSTIKTGMTMKVR